MSRLKEIHDYLISEGNKIENLLELDRHSVYLSMEIMEYAHRNIARENCEPYANHPTNVMNNYRRLINLIPSNPFSIDKDLLYECGIPFDGVQEVALLHDVIEDTDFTIEQIEEIFDECDLKDYFNLYIKDALIKITHIKCVDYLTYINICLENPISALVKMMDLQDNMYVLSLTSLDEKKLKRTHGYLNYLSIINNQYHFLEKVTLYKKMFEEE